MVGIQTFDVVQYGRIHCHDGVGKFSSGIGHSVKGLTAGSELTSLHGFIIFVVCSAYRVRRSELAASTRCQARVARARQIAMYLAHVSCGLTLTEVGRLFGRDRTTAAHACRQIEDQRDDPDVDLALTALDSALNRWRTTAWQPRSA